MTMYNIPKMLTINETATMTHLPKHFIRQLVIDKKISYVRAGKKYLINLEKLIKYLDSGDNAQKVDGISE